jgi:hypothetical protein
MAVENLPASHSVHAIVDDEPPFIEPKVPVGHSSQVGLDEAAENLPSGHWVQESSADEKVPASQGVHEWAPSLDVEPEAHASQVKDEFAPVTAEYVPLGQSIQVSTESPPSMVLYVP